MTSWSPTAPPGLSSLVAEGPGEARRRSARVTLQNLRDARNPNDATLPMIPDSATALTQFWEGENMTVDSRRKLAFMSRDSGQKGFRSSST